MVFVFVSYRGGPYKEKIDVCDATHNMLPGKIMKKTRSMTLKNSKPKPKK